MRSLKIEMTEMPVTSAVAALASLLLAWFIKSLIFHRSYFQKLQAQGLPMPPHNFILGHLPILIRAVGSLPKDAHPLYLTTQIRTMYPDLGPNFYLDAWPFADALLVLGSPEVMHQIAFDRVLNKTHILENYLRPLTGGNDIVSINGAAWKKWRGIFNPGFSPAHLMTLIPLIVEETEVFCKELDKHVTKRDIFQIKSLTDNLILDVIGQVAMGVRFRCQTSYNQVIHSLRTQVKWLVIGTEPNPFDRYHPLRPLVHWYHGRIVNNYIFRELDKRFQAWHDDSTPKDQPLTAKRNRTVIDLAIKAYTESLPQSPTATKPTMDAHFRKICHSQLKVFLFSGHDTTSSAICFHLYLLSQNRECLARLQAEHDAIFGTDPSLAATQITTSPYLLHQLPYTTGVIKESLRLFPTVTNTRAGEQGYSVIDARGTAFPTDNVTVFPNTHTCHRDPTYWARAEEFVPERWLVTDPKDPLLPVKGMWRAFEQGPRNCIAQELAMLEMKVVLVLVCRSYRFDTAYEVGRGRRPEEVLGHRAYQVAEMGPKRGLPVRVSRV